MMKKKNLLGWASLIIFILSPFVEATADLPAVKTKSTGEIVNGFRILTIEGTNEKVKFTVCRGDYIKFYFDASVGDMILTIPALSIKEVLPVESAQTPYFKMKESGTIEFSLGNTSGSIVVIDYRQKNYRELTSEQAASFIEATQPLILDVRTPYEYKTGHLKNARLIPVQELRGRLNEISTFKDREILVYCATGNRSTVASKIMRFAFCKIEPVLEAIHSQIPGNKPIL